MARGARDTGIKRFDELSIELTHKCNLNCIFCSSQGSRDKTTFIEISRVKDVIEEVKNEFDIKKVSLSGGEPLLHNDFFELYYYLKNTDLKILIYSSGVLSNHEELKPI